MITSRPSARAEDRNTTFPTGWHGAAHTDRVWFAVVVVILLLLGAAPLRAQSVSDDFNDGDTAGWTRLDLSQVGLPAEIAEYTFPDDGNGGLAFRIFANPPPADLGAGPARAFAYRPETYGRFRVGVDILDWDNTVDEAYGLIVRGSNLGIGTSGGFVMNFNALDDDLQINSVTGEAPDTIAETPVRLRPGEGPFRWVFTSDGINLLGQVFLRSDLSNPLASVLALDPGLYPSGNIGLFVFDRNDPDAYTYADATFDNFEASAPAAGSLGPAITELTPRPYAALGVSLPLVKVGIVDLDQTVDPDSIRLWLDGDEIPAASLTIEPSVQAPDNAFLFSGATATYQVTTPLAAGVTHTNRVVFRDQNQQFTTNEWTYLGPTLLPATYALPVASGQERGFDVRVVQSLEGQPLANSLERAEQQLAVPPLIPIQIETNVTVEVINYSQVPASDGYFPDFDAFPGIDPLGNTDDFAMETRFHLELQPGYYTFGVRSDDGFQLSTGPSMAEVKAVVLGEQLSGTFDGTFEFAVEAEGLYPFRFVYFERGGGAHVELFQVNRDDPNDRILINDSLNANAIKAWRTVSLPELVLESATSLEGGGFAPDATAVIDTGNRTITIPKAGDMRFYRVQSATAVTIQTIAISGDNVILTY